MTAAPKLQQRPRPLRAPLPTPEIIESEFYSDLGCGGDLEIAFGKRVLDVGVAFDPALRVEIQVVSGPPLTPIEESHVERWVREHIESLEKGDPWEA